MSSGGGRFGSPKCAQRCPRGAQGRAQRRRKEVQKVDLYGDGLGKRFRIDFGAILEPFWEPRRHPREPQRFKNLKKRPERAQRASAASERSDLQSSSFLETLKHSKTLLTLKHKQAHSQTQQRRHTETLTQEGHTHTHTHAQKQQKYKKKQIKSQK